MHFAVNHFFQRLQHLPQAKDEWEPISLTQPVAPDRPPTPQLQVSPPEDLHEFQRREDAELEGYGWIDGKAGIARIPIEQAMSMVVREGLPVRAATNADKVGP